MRSASAIGGSAAAIARLWAAETVWLTVIGGALGLLTVPVADRHDHRAGARRHSAAGRSRDRLAGRRLQHRGHGDRDAAVRRGADPPRRASSTSSKRSTTAAAPSPAAAPIARARRCWWCRSASRWCCWSPPVWWCKASTRCRRLDLGFTREAVLRMKVEPRSTSQPVNTWIASCCRRCAQLPRSRGRPAAVYLTPMELGSIGQGTWAVAEGQPETPQHGQQQSDRQLPERDARLLQGDGHSAACAGGCSRRRIAPTAPRVALISESTAAAFFPGQDPIGKRIKAASFNANQRYPEGVVADHRRRGRQRALQGPARSAARHVRPAGADARSGPPPAWSCG